MYAQGTSTSVSSVEVTMPPSTTTAMGDRDSAPLPILSASGIIANTRVIVLTSGPARMADNFLVDLPHPRTLEMKTQERCGEYARRIYRLLGME